MGTISTPPKEKTALKPCIKTIHLAKLKFFTNLGFPEKTRRISLPKGYHLGFVGRVFGRDET